MRFTHEAKAPSRSPAGRQRAGLDGPIQRTAAVSSARQPSPDWRSAAGNQAALQRLRSAAVEEPGVEDAAPLQRTAALPPQVLSRMGTASNAAAAPGPAARADAPAYMASGNAATARDAASSPQAAGPMQAGASRSYGSAPIQRLPTKEQTIKELGAPVKNVGILKKNSTYYRAVLDSLEKFDRYVAGTELAADAKSLSDQFDALMQLYDAVETAASKYVDAKGGTKGAEAKTRYMQALLRQIPQEKAFCSKYYLLYKNGDGNLKKQGVKWKQLTGGTLVLTEDMNMKQSAKGAINSVAFFQKPEGEVGVFKETKDAMEMSAAEAMEAMSPLASKKQSEQTDADREEMERLMHIRNEADVLDEAGIDVKDMRMANRNIAMTRLDQLLNGGVVAHAELALRETGSGAQVGTFMKKAEGMSGQDLRDVKSGHAPAKAEGADKVSVNDPNLQRCLSRLQLIDALAMQADRHSGNYFIQFDKSGKVTGVTGIDNDLAFGTHKTIDQRVNNYPGISRFVDKELAERILALKPKDLIDLLQDLLAPDELKALTTRLEKLQSHLRDKKTQLLTPQQWSDATAEGLLMETRKNSQGKALQNTQLSYFGHFKAKADDAMNSGQ